MPEVALFCEDSGHEQVIKALIARESQLRGIYVTINPYSARHGHGRVISELKTFANDVQRGGLRVHPDLVVAAIDANCKGTATETQ